MITRIEDYFSRGCGRCARFDTPDCSTRQWHSGLAELRQVCQQTGLLETVKWGHPCYVQGNRNIAIIGAFRDNFRLSFFNAALLKDPQGVLEKQGPHARHPGILRFTANPQVAEMAPLIRSYLEEAIGYAKAGTLPKKEEVTIELPEELADSLAADPELAEAFQKLTPGRQKSYAINIGSAKQVATRMARITRFRDKILAGKGALER
ncbi:MAG: YdeI/OmpD-associated family protein [Gammaproteobacteria bacterium]|nr:YdeI/OmpD-associated family protein [Pseudomonadales bacterium]MCP5346518.1 YdeI/OmpD-associated family protein [Pseudomonadales bacterium]